MSIPVPPPPSLRDHFNSLRVRLVVLAALLFLEKFSLNFFVDFASAQTAVGLGAFVRVAQHVVFRFLVTFVATLFLLDYVYTRRRAGTAQVNESVPAASPLWFGMHLLLFAPLVLLSHELYGQRAPLLPFTAVAFLWLGFAVSAVLAAFRAMAPWPTWRRGALSLGFRWVFAFVAAAVAAVAIEWSDRLWEPTARLTFALVARALRPFIADLQADATTLTLTSGHFAVRIAEVCSGLEGVGLMLVFCGGWLLLFRKEYRFPRALLLVPAAVVMVFVLNVVRIATLVIIGEAGYPGIAQYGFHSQAGWIAFNLAACAVVLVSRRIPWLCTGAVGTARHAENPSATYLMPFLAMLGAGMVSLALSSGFDALYGLRLLAGVGALAALYPRLRHQDWRFSWRALAVGAIVLIVWIAAARLLLPAQTMPAALAALAPPLRIGWLAIRIVTAVAIVPVAEELAYRGYLLRRLISEDFEAVSYSAVRWPALLISSLVFGLGHGSMWLAGVVAGWLYGALLRRTGRIGESVAAHATTNSLLAITALASGHWELL
jgi:exosortase E/protease (VPEID-CTERM system)